MQWELIASPLVTYGIGGIAVLVALIGGLLYGSAAARDDADWAGARFIGFATVWMAGTAVAARSGLLQRFDLNPPPMFVMMCLVAGFALVLGFGRVGRRLSTLPLAVLVGVQAFRLPLEYLMHRGYQEGLVPVYLTYAGYNLDIVWGTLAVPLAVALALGMRSRFLLVFWNVCGLISLFVIGFLAVSGSPLFKRFGEAPGDLNTWVLHFPFVWVPTVLVVAALVGHIVVFRALKPAR